MNKIIVLLVFSGFLFDKGLSIGLIVNLDQTVCEALPIGTVIGTFQVSNDGFNEAPYQFTILNPEFSAYVEVDNGGLVNNPDGGTVNVKLKGELNREDTALFEDIEVYVADARGDADSRTVSFVQVLDANDNDPAFSDIPYTTDVWEHPWTNGLGITVTVNDGDEGNAGNVGVETDNNRLDLIRSDENINIYQLELKSEEMLDFETSPVLTSQITATDGGSTNGCGDSSQRSTDTTAVINIKDGPDQPPFFGSTYDFNLDEDTTVGFEFLKVEAIDRDYSLAWQMRYEIVPNGVAENWFDIDSSTGQISVKQKIDREDDSVQSSNGNFQFDVKATEVVPDGFELSPTPEAQFPFSTTTTVTIRISDINDNGPVFYDESSGNREEENNFEAYLEENTPNLIAVPGLSIVVQDKDEAGPENHATFSLSDNSDVFDVVPTLVSGETNVVLRVADATALDFETTKSFVIEIIAIETKTAEKNSATATITVYLEDANDNSPVFDESSRVGNVSEDALKSAEVIKVNATDADSGENAAITYSLQQNNVFVIDENTGIITLNGELDREQLSQYSLTVAATDGGGRTTNINLQVNVLDVNDNEPKFQALSYFGIVRENSLEFVTPLTISATDADEANSPNSEIEFSIVKGDLMDYFEVVKDDDVPNSQVTVGSVKPSQEIDLEALGFDIEECSDDAVVTTITVEARDKGNPELSSTVEIRITIQDDNDQYPVFDATEYSGSVPEFSPRGTEVLTVSATDNDACPPNNVISYQIDPEFTDALSAFQIETQTGKIEVRDANLDRDEKRVYSFIVRANDLGDENFGEATVTITLNDVNDKDPIFTSDETDEIEEEQGIGTVVWIVMANDTDSDSNLSYTIEGVDCYGLDGIQQTSCENPFTLEDDVDMQVGKLVVASRIDRETTLRYVLRISVEDKNAGLDREQKVTEAFDIRLIDINDNAPRFNEYNEDSFDVDEETTNAVIGVVTARDDDEGLKGSVAYSITGEGQAYVAIDQNGQITTIKGIDREEIGDWLDVTVRAEDQGSPPLKNNTIIRIRINDVNDHDPEFLDNGYSGEVAENAPIGEEVLTVYANDSDIGTAALIQYTITAGNQFGRFDIDDATGIITVAKELDRDAGTDSYALTVVARDEDGATNGRTAQTSVVIDITDVNDNAPSFAAEIYPINLKEDTDVDEEIDSQFADDIDTGDNSRLVYSIINEEDHFKIDRDSGVVSVAKSIANGEDEYLVEIMAEDSGTPSLNSTYQLVINVIDVNLNAPVFENLDSNTEIVVPEDSEPFNTEVFEVMVSDADRGQNGDVTFSMESEDDIFDIYPNGIIYTKETLDYETKSTYEVTVTATDRAPGDEALSTIVTFDISIGDVDDNDPYYPEGDNEQTIQILEETTTVNRSKVKAASDDDTEANSVNYYFIIGGSASSQFTLDPTDRALTLTQSLDRETFVEYDLVVTVSKDPDFTPAEENVDWKEVQSENTMLHVIIDLIDINDNAPVFQESEYIADVPFDSQPNSDATIVQVRAIDADSEPNAEVVYAVESTIYVRGEREDPAEGTFGIQKARDLVSGDLYLDGNIDPDLTGQYVVKVSATDPDGQMDVATIRVGIITSDQSVVLYSLFAPNEFPQEKFRRDLGQILNGVVIVESIEPHDPNELPEGSQQTGALSNVRFHAKQNGSTELIERDIIVGVLSTKESQDFRVEFGIVGLQQAEPLPDNTEKNLLIILIVLAAVVVIVIIGFTCSIIYMRRKYNRKLRVAEATTSAANEIADMNQKSQVPVLPNTNDFAGGENPLFVENQKNAIDLDGWYNHQESQDDDDEIDDNAVDDSAIAINSDRNSNQSDDGQNLEDGQFEIDFEKGDNARLAAALNAANQRRGGDNLTYIFDQEMDNTAM